MLHILIKTDKEFGQVANAHDWMCKCEKMFHFANKEICKVKVTQSRPTLWDPMDCSLPGPSVQGILQARILERVAVLLPPFSSGSSQPRDRTHISCVAGGVSTAWATREFQEYGSG